MENLINNIDFNDRINQLKIQFQKVLTVKHFFADYPSEIRKALNNIDPSQPSIVAPIRLIMQNIEHSLLIECYTISEQLLKNSKYDLLDFDISMKSPVQKFLQYKIEPSKFSPNAKVQEINKFFKRYDGNKLFVKNLKIYDDMITCRHKYAHNGVYTFDLSNLPKLIEILNYLEFEYRMFLEKGPWWLLFKYIYSIENKGGNKSDKNIEYQKLKKDILPCVPKVRNIINAEKNFVTDKIYTLLDKIEQDCPYNEICTEFENIRKECDSYINE